MKAEVGSLAATAEECMDTTKAALATIRTVKQSTWAGGEGRGGQGGGAAAASRCALIIIG